MKYLKLIAAAVVMFSLSAISSARTAPKGHLLIIGGGERPDYMIERFIDLAGGRQAQFLVIYNASDVYRDPFLEQLASLGVKNVRAFAPTREQADDPEFVKVLDGVTGVFFTGGSQAKIVRALRGTLLHRKLAEMYEKGGIIGGTSAGAGMMSDPMIVGNSKNADPEGVNAVGEDQVNISEGMGFFKGAVIDQHFFKRKRANRMISGALEHPDHTFFGIDESTALLVSEGNKVEVIGLSNVMVIEPGAKGVKNDSRGHYGTSGVRMRLLVEGDRYRVR